ncbi:MAG TPA: SCO family protein [Bryobacteraceae bacterium]|nr:SCO family protein [Bryobacteraceae bacterium]
MKPRAIARSVPPIPSRAKNALLFASVLLAGFSAACTMAKPLPMYGEVPRFQLTAQTGKPFDSRLLEGKVWVADFVFTNCPGPCPMMSQRMRQVQDLTAKLPNVRLVSFTVDPARDTPPVLAEYARHFQAQPGRWFFLTGPQPALDALGFQDFKLNHVDGSFLHSTRFALVDGRGRIRGYYRFTDDDMVQQVVSGVRQLSKEPT